MKRSFFAVIMIAILTLSLSVTAFAADPMQGENCPVAVYTTANNSEYRSEYSNMFIVKVAATGQYLAVYASQPAVYNTNSGWRIGSGYYNFMGTCMYVLMSSEGAILQTEGPQDGLDATLGKWPANGYVPCYSTSDVKSYSGNWANGEVFFLRPLTLPEVVQSAVTEQAQTVVGTMATVAVFGVGCLASLTALVLLRKKLFLFLH